MKRIFAVMLSMLVAFSLAACSGAPAAQAPAPAAEPAQAEAPAPEPTQAPLPTEAPTPVPTEEPTPEPTQAPIPFEAVMPEGADPAAPYFVAFDEDGMPAPDRIEAKTGKDNAVRLIFAIENGEGMIGWDREALAKAGIQSDMSFEFIEDKGLMVIVWSEGGATECSTSFFINGSEDWAKPDILYEKEFTFVFTA